MKIGDKMVEKDEMKSICDTFDEYFELEGKEQITCAKTLMPRIEKACVAIMSCTDEVFQVNLNWLIWMYGKLAHGEGNQDLLAIYKDIKEELDEYDKEIASTHKIFTTYGIATFVEKE